MLFRCQKPIYGGTKYHPMLCRLALVDDRVRRVAASRGTSTGVEPLVERVRDRVPRLPLRRSF
jgi:hypothetical protein